MKSGAIIAPIELILETPNASQKSDPHRAENGNPPSRKISRRVHRMRLGRGTTTNA
jgi:hypothetical protein